MPSNRVDRGMSLPAGRGQRRVRSWGLSRNRDEAGRSVKTGVTGVGVGARIMASACFALADFSVTTSIIKDMCYR